MSQKYAGWWLWPFFMLCCYGAGAQMGSRTNWERIGPGGGGATFSPTMAYQRPEDFIVKCDMTGSYLTHDGGRSYSQTNFIGGATTFAYDPKDADVVYAGGTFLHRSVDGGKTWERIFPHKRDIKATTYFGDHAEFHLETFDTALYHKDANEITAIHIDPTSPQTIYFALGHFFFYSFDNAANWHRQDIHAPIQALYTHRHSLSHEVYIFTSHAIFIFNKHSKKIITRELPMAPASAFAAGTVKHMSKTIFYAVCGGQLWTSSDEGRSWQSHPARPNITRVACAEYDAANAYVIADHFEDSEHKIWYGVLKTGDEGQSWHWVWKAGGGSGQYRVQDASDAENIKDSWVHGAFGGELIELMDAGVSPNDGHIVIVTDWYRMMKTVDGGKTWNQIYSTDHRDGSFSTRGLDVTTSYGVHFDPFNSKHVAISYTDIGFHHSYDGGKSWRRSVSGVPTDWNNTCYGVVFDPVVKNMLWGVWSGMHDLPRGKMTRNPEWKTSATAKGGVCVSTDGGVSWQPSTTGMGDHSPATSIILDPASPPHHRTLYATVYNKGVFKSTDDGQTWTLSNQGIDTNTCAFKIVRAGNGDLYLIVSPTPRYIGQKGASGRQAADRQEGGDLYSGAVYKSIDGAASWKKLTLVPGLIFANGIAVNPANPKQLYVACWAGIEGAEMPGGIFASEDGGDTWRSIFDQRQYVYDVTIDAWHPGRLYACTFNQAAYRSDDGGKSWRRLKGYDFHWGQRVVIDEHDHEKIYITTYGSSVWHGTPVVIIRK